MATILDSEPAAEQALFSDWNFELRITDIGTETVQILIAYKLIDVATGNEIVPLESIKVPAAGDSVNLNFTREIMQYLSTPVFNVQSGNIFVDANFEAYQKFQVRLDYGDVVINGDVDPCESTVNTSKESSVITFYNWAEYGEGDLTGETWMNTKAERLYWCKGFPDYVSAKANGILPFAARDIHGVVASGDLFKSVTQDTNVQILFNVWDTDGDGSDEELEILEYFIGGESVVYAFEDCCCNGGLQAAMMFLDPKGGRNVLPFGCVEESGMGVEQTIVCLDDFRIEEDPVVFHYAMPDSVFRDRIIQKKSFETFQLNVRQPSSRRNRVFFSNFFASKEHHLLLRVEGETTIFILPAILEGGGTTFQNEEAEVDIRVNVRAARPIAIQNA